MADITDLTAGVSGETGTGTPSPRDDEAAAGGVVRLTIPAEARFLRLARLTAAGLAGDLDYGVDAIEDLRIAVDELCAAVIADVDPAAELTISYTEEDGALVVEGFCSDVRAPAPELHPVAQELLKMLADEHGVWGGASGRTFRLVKRARPDR